MNLLRALRADSTSKIAFVGAGGKTTAIFQLARQMNRPVIVTTSTHLGDWQISMADQHVTINRPVDLDRIVRQVDGVTLLTGPSSKDEKVSGLSDASFVHLSQLLKEIEIPVLIEADGSRSLPIKAPGPHEPVLPAWVNHVVICQGMSAIGEPLSETNVHRAEIFADLSGIPVGKQITAEGLARVITHPQGGLKNIPRAAQVSALLTQVDDDQKLPSTMRVANIISGHLDSIVICNLNKKVIWSAIEPSAGILLAAGGSTRFGDPKILLDWKGKSLIRHAAEIALAGGLYPVIVVLGAVIEPAINALEGLPVEIVINENWQQGQSTSVRSGVQSLNANIGSATFLLADQPFVSAHLVNRLILHHNTSLASVIAPRVMGKRANPVLFDRDTFADLIMLSGDAGGRSIIDRYNMEYLEWDDESILIDIDSPDIYEQLMKKDDQ